MLQVGVAVIFEEIHYNSKCSNQAINCVVNQFNLPPVWFECFVISVKTDFIMFLMTILQAISKSFMYNIGLWILGGLRMNHHIDMI